MGNKAVSTIAWVDFSDSEREKVNEAIKAFCGQDTIDELGLGQVRDGFADLLFPGTTTIQTRLRYMLFVPWICRGLEDQRVSSDAFPERLKKNEVRLIDALKSGGAEEGLIGMSAGASLQRFPSELYWSGTRTWGIRLFPGSRREYARHLDRFYRRIDTLVHGDDGEPLGTMTQNWHPVLPDPAKHILHKTTFDLTPGEADYLTDMVRKNCSGSILAHLFAGPRTEPADVQFVWQHPGRDRFPEQLSVHAWHARRFSEVIHGANLLYNLRLCEKTDHDEARDDYKRRMEAWLGMIHEELHHFRSWDQAAFWNLARQGAGRRIHPQTRAFIEDWIELSLSHPGLADLLSAESRRRLLEKREHSVKGRRARLICAQRRERWSPGSGDARFDFRWDVVTTYLADLKNAYEGDSENA